MKRVLRIGIWAVAIPAVVLAGVLIFPDQAYAVVSLAVAVLSLIPFFLTFERGAFDGRGMAVLAAMIALTVVARVVFMPLPGFKPVTAMVVIVGIYLGREAGFLTGALSAVISNFFFGQGPWTPFQMLVWGLIGLVAGVLAGLLRKSRVALCVYGVAAGAVFSLVMDAWSMLWWDGGWNAARYLASLIAAAPFTALYAASNVVFLLILIRPVGKRLERIKHKYGLFGGAG